MASSNGNQPTKMEIMLGFVERRENREQILKVQFQGEASVREAGGHNRIGIWGSQKVFLIIKDGFLIWFKEKSKKPFNKKPKIVFPLENAHIQVYNGPETRLAGSSFATTSPKKSFDSFISVSKNTTSKRSGGNSKSTTFEIWNKKIPGSHFHIKMAAGFDAQNFIQVFKQGAKVTHENVLLGRKLLQDAAKHSEKLEQQKAIALKALAEKQLKLEKAQIAKDRVLERERQQKENFQRQLEQEQRDIEAKLRERQAVDEMLQQQTELIQEAKMKRKMLENKLNMANIALKNLEKSLEKYFAYDEELEKAAEVTKAPRQTAPVQRASSSPTSSGNQLLNDLPKAFPRKTAPSRSKNLITKPEQNKTLAPGEVADSVEALRFFFEDTFESHKALQRKQFAKRLSVLQEGLKGVTEEVEMESVISLAESDY